MLFMNNDRVVFLGDSLTKRTKVTDTSIPAVKYQLEYAGSYVDILLKRLLVNFPKIQIEAYNKGIGGNTVLDLLDRLERDVLSLKPDWVVLFVGQNDMGKMSIPEFESGLKRLLNELHENKIKVIQLSTTPSPGEVEKNKKFDICDAIIERLCRKYNSIYVDVKSKFKAVMDYNEDAETPVIIFNQGCHLTELGNMLLADEVFEVVVKSKQYNASEE